MKIYTKQGDEGQTVLFDGTRVAKDHLRIQIYGTIDELNSYLGLAVAECGHPSLRELLGQLQRQLLTLGSDLATPAGARNEAKVRRIGEREVAFLEQQIDEATAQLPPLKRFIVPGGRRTAAQLHVARTICRRAERLVVSHIQNKPGDDVGPQPLIFINRLSDLLFTLARLANKLDGVSDIEWKNE